MLWRNFADLFGMHVAIARPLFFHLAVLIYIYTRIWTGKNFTWVRILAIIPCVKSGLAGNQQIISGKF